MDIHPRASRVSGPLYRSAQTLDAPGGEVRVRFSQIVRLSYRNCCLATWHRRLFRTQKRLIASSVSRMCRREARVGRATRARRAARAILVSVRSVRRRAARTEAGHVRRPQPGRLAKKEPTQAGGPAAAEGRAISGRRPWRAQTAAGRAAALPKSSLSRAQGA
jgi:hypothetical protein